VESPLLGCRNKRQQRMPVRPCHQLSGTGSHKVIVHSHSGLLGHGLDHLLKLSLYKTCSHR
jgi:hypothetical protein